MRDFWQKAYGDEGWMSWKTFDSLTLPLLGFDIETYSPQGFPKNFEDPVVAATITIAQSLKLGQGLIIISLIYPPCGESLFLKQLLIILASISKGSLITYNGLRFDIAYLIVRAEKYGLNARKILSEHKHIDLYQTIRRMGVKLPSYGQKNVEKLLGIRREVTGISGATYHYHYESFLKTGNLKPLLYNIEDSIGCLKILSKLNSKNFN